MAMHVGCCGRKDASQKYSGGNSGVKGEKKRGNKKKIRGRVKYFEKMRLVAIITAEILSFRMLVKPASSHLTVMW